MDCLGEYHHGAGIQDFDHGSGFIGVCIGLVCDFRGCRCGLACCGECSPFHENMQNDAVPFLKNGGITIYFSRDLNNGKKPYILGFEDLVIVMPGTLQ